jgi:glycosyltransferase involved in cell wall biosynthesis
MSVESWPERAGSRGNRRRFSAESSGPHTALFVGADAKYMLDFRGAILSQLQERGYRVVVFAAPLGNFDPAAFEARNIEFVPWRVSKAGLNPFMDIGSALSLWAVLRRFRPQIVFAHTIKTVIYAMMMSWLAGVGRRVAMIPGLGYAFTDIDGDAAGRLKRRMVGAAAWMGYRLSLSLAHMVIFHNDDDCAELRRIGAVTPRTPAEVVNGSGVDMTRFVPAALPEGPTTFLFVARLLRDKGVHEFVEAARIVKAAAPQTRFVLVGAADANPTAVSPEVVKAWEAEGVVEIRGHVADTRAAYAECHVFVLPSYREGTPRTNLEAMATARAIITTDVPGCRATVIEGLNGLLTPPRDARALAEAMLRLANDPERVRQMGEASLRICKEKFELGAVARATTMLVAGEPEPDRLVEATNPVRQGTYPAPVSAALP